MHARHELVRGDRLERPVVAATVAGVAGRSGGPDAAALREWANARLGKTQRLADVRYLQELPRSDIGKVLKRDLREGFTREAAGRQPS